MDMTDTTQIPKAAAAGTFTIPGTSSLARLEANLGAAEVELSDTDFADIAAA
jgi:aryl-alcohol dehydrogenase-like predicted oxidoreductase